MTPIGPVLRRIMTLNRCCRALRQAFLAAHPDSPRTLREREHERLRALLARSGPTAPR